MDLAELRKAGVFMEADDYYLVGTYPPLKALPEIRAEEALSGATEFLNLYFHIPFCHQRCTFCHFAKEIRPPQERIERYVGAIERELAAISCRLGRRLKGKTVFFGGGTPSYLTPRQLERLFSAIQRHCDLSANEETTFELHPAVVAAPDFPERLAVLKTNGVNRWVFGVQSMDGEVLKRLNRGHSPQDVLELLDALRDSGCTNVSIDLMYGLPYQTVASWFSTLTQLVKYGVTKFNIFGLMFKRTDPVWVQRVSTPAVFPSDNDRLRMHLIAEFCLADSGFRAGPLLYYSKEETHSRQANSKLNDIEEVNLLPVGVSGFGYVGHTQYYNHCDLSEYLNRVETSGLSVWRGATLDREERMRRHVMFAIRSNGVCLRDFKERYSADLLEAFRWPTDELVSLGLLRVEAGYLALTERGRLCAEGIALRFVSDRVSRAVSATNRLINRNKSLLEKYDFSPIGR
jgi:oxygen-independent coproporphyrinogen III oxidase